MHTHSAWNRYALPVFCLIFVLSLFISAPVARAAEEGQAAKAILAKWQDTVIAVKATIKVCMIVEGCEQSKEENEVETLATVIDPLGVSVLSFSSIDPTRIYGGLLKKFKAAGEGPQMDIKCDITGMTMVLPDGREIPAKVVLRDGDLDLAFVRPAEKLTKPVAALDLSGEARPDVLDTVLILGRLDKSAGRGPSACLQRIESVIAIPRKYYVADSSSLMSRLGAPVFSLDGKVVGFSLLRMTKSNDKPGMGSMLTGGMNALGIMPVVLPVGEVAAVAKQAIAMKEQ